ncbi:hypothetical protein K435DRAFT_966831 [Dendrothele bispora CBS 962.96]|uniref:Uncharacterized protein n=1 Tax=Dendrothele bispora (strain CBS 962.96) TaxID=1314807 RepID=A0A4S8LXV4_DENBC|nr:hypothetical protein K435DRAFT_966831 [Dendrothele bispora CBS 962.96]
MSSSSISTSKAQSNAGLKGFKQLLKKGWNEIVNIRSKNSREVEEEPKYKPRGQVAKPIGGPKPPKPAPQGGR